MEPFLTSTAIVAVAEIGDKTQLLAIILAAKFRRPWAILTGILVATIANHFIAAFAGAFLASLIEATWFRTAVGLSFIAMSAWALIPDKLEGDEASPASKGGVFLTTLVAFFLIEIGDKTQVATIALGAHYQQVVWVTLGTTLGMLLANAAAVWLGGRIVEFLPLKTIRIVAALLFAVLGFWVIAST